jgi:uncharacterized protein (TIGR00106 family)
MFKNSDVSYQLTPMGTVFEVSSFEEATNVLNLAYKELESDCSRVYSTVKFDIRKGKENRIKGKIKSIEEKIGVVNK